MAFRVLKKVKEAGLNSTYVFVTESKEGNVRYVEFDDKKALDEYVETELNLGTPKTSLEVVEYIKYTVSADIDTDENTDTTLEHDEDEV